MFCEAGCHSPTGQALDVIDPHDRPQLGSRFLQTCRHVRHGHVLVSALCPRPIVRPRSAHMAEAVATWHGYLKTTVTLFAIAIAPSSPLASSSAWHVIPAQLHHPHGMSFQHSLTISMARHSSTAPPSAWHVISALLHNSLGCCHPCRPPYSIFTRGRST